MPCFCGSDTIDFDEWFNLVCSNCGNILVPEGEYGYSYGKRIIVKTDKKTDKSTFRIES